MIFLFHIREGKRWSQCQSIRNRDHRIEMPTKTGRENECIASVIIDKQKKRRRETQKDECGSKEAGREYMS